MSNESHEIPPHLLPDGQRTIGTQFDTRPNGRVRWGNPTDVLDTPGLPNVDRVVVYDDKAAVAYSEDDGEYTAGCDITDVTELVKTVSAKAATGNLSFYKDIGVRLGEKP